jgi:alkylation response protein AidB-like acyl-CoA dehydrogenase
MDFSIPQEYLDFKAAVSGFARERIAPRAQELDARGEFSWENWRDLAGMGLLGLPFPDQYGGSEASPLATCIAMEAVAAAGADAGTTLAWGAHTILCGVPIWLLGNEAQKEKYLPKLCSGEWVGAFGLTEPGSGSDAAAMRTFAEKRGDRWILNGSKMFITNAPIAHVFIIFAATTKGAGNKGISAFIVERDAPGFTVGKDLVKMGNRTSVTAELSFDNCEVPAENLLGLEGMGFLTVGKETLEWERSCLIAPIVGGMEYMLECSTAYAKERKQFGRPIAEFQAIQMKLADMATELDAARMLVYRAAWKKDAGSARVTLESAMAKLFVTEAAQRIIDAAVQVHGGTGVVRGSVVERLYREVRALRIYEGTSEIQRLVIASQLLR